MSQQTDPEPFQFQPGSPLRRAGNPIRNLIILAVVAIIVIPLALAVAIGVYKYGFGTLKVSDQFIPVTATDLWDDYSYEPDKADAKYKNRKLEVSGRCSVPEPAEPPVFVKTDVHAGYNVQLGPTTTGLGGTSYHIYCFIPAGREKEFARVTEGGMLTIRGRCYGKHVDQIVLADVSFVEFDASK